jgi:hypothetical protein
MAKKSVAQLKADLAAAKAQAAAASKKYQKTKSYDPNFAEVKADNDGAINDLNKAQAALDAAQKPVPKSFTETASSAELKRTRQSLVDANKQNQGIIASTDPTDPQHIAAVKSVADVQGRLDAIDAAISKKVPIETAKAKVEKAKADQGAALDNVKSLQAKKATVLQQDPNADTSKIDQDIANQQAVATKTIPTTSEAGKPQELRYGPNGESLAPGTPEYLTGSTAKPVIKPVTTPAGAGAGAAGKSGKGGAGKTAGGGAAGSGTTKLTPDEAHAKAEAALVALNQGGQYAVQMGLVNSDESLKAIFYKDVYLPILSGKKPVDPSLFQSDILNSKWYATYDDNSRTAQAIKYGDSKTWDKSVESAKQIIVDEARTAGYDLTTDQVSTLANYALNNSGGKAERITGLVLTQLQKQIANTGKFNPTGGNAAVGVSNLKSTASDFGVAHLYTDAQLQGFQDQIEKGTTTQAAVEAQFKSAASSAYSALAPQIGAGLNVKSILAPYTSLYGSTLEVDPNAADISDPKFANQVFMQDPTDPSKQILKPLWQYQADLKKDPRWAYTDNARADLSSTGLKVLQNLGLAY